MWMNMKTAYKKKRAYQKKKKAGKGLPSVYGWLHGAADYLICAYIILVLAVLPLYFPDGYSYIATMKNAFYGKYGMVLAKGLALVAALYGALRLVGAVRAGKGGLRGSVKGFWDKAGKTVTAVDLFAAGYGTALAVSFLCTRYRETALWGEGGWNMGFCTQMMFVCSYFLIAKVWKPRKLLFHMMLPVSAVVFALGYLNRFGIYPAGTGGAGPAFISTIGNINWYCGYATTVFFGGAALLWQSVGRGGRRAGGPGDGRDGGICCGGDGKAGGKTSGKAKGKTNGKAKGKASSKTKAGEGCERGIRVWLYGGLSAAYVFIGFATLVTQGSSGGIWALAVVMVSMFCLSAGEGGRMLGFGIVALLFWASCLLTRMLCAMAPERLDYHDRIVDFLTTGIFPIAMTVVSFLFAGLIWHLVGKGAYSRKLFRILACTVGAAAICAVACTAVMVWRNTLHPGSLGKLSANDFFTFSDSWGSNRGATWKCGLKVFMEQDFLHKLTGVGPDAMGAYIYSDGSGELLEVARYNFGTLRLTNAHNEWLTVLANTGVFGLAGFAGMMVSAMVILLTKGRRDIYACACGLCLLAYTANNIFSFQQVMNTPGAFVLLGMGMAFCERGGNDPGNGGFATKIKEWADENITFVKRFCKLR